MSVHERLRKHRDQAEHHAVCEEEDEVGHRRPAMRGGGGYARGGPRRSAVRPHGVDHALVPSAVAELLLAPGRRRGLAAE
eukprot:2696711-Pleurochrysis_carterae.AAC.1